MSIYIEFKQVIESIKVDLNIPAEIKDKLSMKIENFKLANAVLTIYDEQSWDKKKLIRYITRKKYTYKIPKAFSGLSVKIFVKSIGKQITVILFKSGKCVIVGLTPATVDGLIQLAKHVKKIITQSKCTKGKPKFTYSISNKVYSFNIAKQDFPGTLCDWYNTLSDARRFFEYNPIMFPGATIRVPNYSSVILLFNSRKGIITGGKNVPEYLEYTLVYLDNYIKELKLKLL